MKLFRLPVLLGKGFISHVWLTVGMMGSLVLASCEDEADRLSTAAPISFTFHVDDSGTPASRSVESVDTPHDAVTELQGAPTPLYLHTLYADNMASPLDAYPADTLAHARAIPVTGTNLYDAFGVSAYSYTDAWDESQTPNYMYNVTVRRSDDVYLPASTYYWPGASYKLKFFAYAPQGNSQYVLSGDTHAGAPTIDVTMPSDVSEQKDLLVAQSAELSGNTNTAVPLAFKHALTAVKFVCGADMQAGTVKSIQLKNIYSKATYQLGTSSWTAHSESATFAQTIDKATTGTANEAITTDAQTFMMIPQTLPDDAQIEIVFTDQANTEHTLTATLKGTQWPIGKTVTYQLSSTSINWQYTFGVVGRLTDYTYKGGSVQYTVTSYRKKGTVSEPVAWTTQYSTDNGTSWTDTKPTWLTEFTESDAGAASGGRRYTATVSKQLGIEQNRLHTEALMAVPAKGTETTPYNLSNANGQAAVQHTANCYVVNASGFYSFPLVYGNAIKAGNTNTSAYQSTQTSSNVLKTLVNHLGNGITDPYISNNAGCVPAKAELVWQDTPNLVTDITYNPGTNGGNISFKVDKEYIRQGNAVIAIKDASNAILWSWHIWVTDEAIDQTIEVTNYQQVKYKLMPVSLGWCDGNTYNYPERSCLVRFKADKQTRIVTIKQKAGVESIGGNLPFYQWGRKDPILPSTGKSYSDKTWYAADGSSSTTILESDRLGSGVERIKQYILKPERMGPGTSTFYNLWNINNKVTGANDDVVIKTIYDPCPVGYKLPAGNAFTGFTNTGMKVETPADFNGGWDKDRIGGVFYAEPNKTGEQIFFAHTGWRSYSTSPRASNVEYTAICWSAALGNKEDQGSALSISSSWIDPVISYGRSYGITVRPAQE